METWVYGIRRSTDYPDGRSWTEIANLMYWKKEKAINDMEAWADNAASLCDGYWERDEESWHINVPSVVIYDVDGNPVERMSVIKIRVV